MMQGEMDGVSVVICVHNGEKYLPRCLDSLYAQDYGQYEVILVDDGSTDASGGICDEYACRYQGKVPTVVIHKPNGGLVRARMDGVRHARYGYVSFMDADDWADRNHFSGLMRGMERTDADAVAGGALLERRGKTEFKDNLIADGFYGERELQTVVYPKMLYFDGFFSFGVLPYMWNKIFRKDLLERCYEIIDPSVYDGEDVLTFFTYMLFAKSILLIRAHTYHYCVTGDSMTERKRADYLSNVSRLYLNMDGIFSQTGYYAVLKPQLDQYMRMMVFRSDPAGYVAGNGFVFPFARIPRDSRVILYGAGLMGRTFVHQIRHSEYCRLAGWLDREYGKIVPFGEITVRPVEELKQMVYDYIVIAIADISVAEDVKKHLCREYGIREDRIVLGVSMKKKSHSGEV